MSISSRRNLDFAFPPLAPGLPSVYERAGFEVNRLPAESSHNGNGSIKSRGGSASRSLHNMSMVSSKHHSSGSRTSSIGDAAGRNISVPPLASKRRNFSSPSLTQGAGSGGAGSSSLSLATKNSGAASRPTSRSISAASAAPHAPHLSSGLRSELSSSSSSSSTTRVDPLTTMARKLSDTSLSSDRSRASDSSVFRTSRSSHSSTGTGLSLNAKCVQDDYCPKSAGVHSPHLMMFPHQPSGNPAPGIPHSSSLEFGDVHHQEDLDDKDSVRHKLAMNRYQEHGVSVTSLTDSAGQSNTDLTATDKPDLGPSPDALNADETAYNPASEKASAVAVAPIITAHTTAAKAPYPVSPDLESGSSYTYGRDRFSRCGRNRGSSDTNAGSGANISQCSQGSKFSDPLPLPHRLSMDNTNRFSTTSSVYLPEDDAENRLESVEETELEHEEEYLQQGSAWQEPKPRAQEKAQVSHISNWSATSSRLSRTKECRGCRNPIVGKSIHSRDGNLSGRWHIECFRCIECADDLVGDVFVLEDLPYCQHCYHKANNTLCSNCNEGVEGDCLESYSEDREEIKCRRYHLHCLICHTCSVPLQSGDIYEYENMTFCTRHGAKKAETNNNVQRRQTRMLLI